MKYLFLALAVFVFAPIVHWTHPHQPIHPLQMQQAPMPITLPPVFSCADDANDNCDAQRPWMRGHIEKYCGKTDDQVKAMQDANPGATILKCACHHVCNSKDPMAGETGGRTWDAKCESRCNPKNCTCMTKCDS